MMQSILWEPAVTLHTITDIKPQLASWDKSTHPSQLRLQAYRQPIMDELLPLLPENQPDASAASDSPSAAAPAVSVPFVMSIAQNIHRP